MVFGLAWMEDKKITYNIKDKTTKVYFDQDCIYVPIENTTPLTLTEHL